MVWPVLLVPALAIGLITEKLELVVQSGNKNAGSNHVGLTELAD